jgi:tetratricopeptide (TPR) repeat protein
MEAHDYRGEPQPDLKLLVERYEVMLAEGRISFLEKESFLSLADYYEEKDVLEKALIVLENAIEQHPYSAALYVRKAQLRAEQEAYERAFELLEAAMTFEPSNLDIYLTQADIYMRLYDQDSAIRVIRIAKSYASTDELPDLYVLESTIYETKKDYKNALKYLQKALYKDPSNDVALSRLSSLYDYLDNYDELALFLKKLVDRQPYSYWGWYNLGLAYWNAQLWERAVEAFDYAIVIEETFEPAYYYYVDSLYHLERYKEALQYLDDYKRLFGEDGELLYRYGQCYEQQGYYEKARSYYRSVGQYNNLGGRAYYSMGNCYVEEENWTSAEAAFLQAFAIDKFNAAYCLSLADTYDALGNSDRAHEFYHKALALEPVDVEIWIHYLEFLIDEDSHVIALEILEEAKRHIQDVLLDYAQAAILLDVGRRQEGFVVLGNALQEDYELNSYVYRIAPRLQSDLTIGTFILHHKQEKF